MFLPTLSSPIQSLRPQWTAEMPRSENLILSSGVVQLDKKTIKIWTASFGVPWSLLSHDTEGWTLLSGMEQPGCSLSQGIYSAPPAPCARQYQYPGGCLTPTSGGNHSPWAPHHRDAHALHDHR